MKNCEQLETVLLIYQVAHNYFIYHLENFSSNINGK